MENFNNTMVAPPEAPQEKSEEEQDKKERQFPKDNDSKYHDQGILDDSNMDLLEDENVELEEKVKKASHEVRDITRKNVQSLLDRQSKAFEMLAEITNDRDFREKIFEADSIPAKQGGKKIFAFYRDMIAKDISEQGTSLADKEKKINNLFPWINQESRVDYQEVIKLLEHSGTKDMLEYFDEQEDLNMDEKKVSKFGLREDIGEVRHNDDILKKIIGSRMEYDPTQNKKVPNKLIQEVEKVLAEIKNRDKARRKK